MPPFGPISRLDLIRYLRQAGFEGPFAGHRHQFMLRGVTRIRVPNPHPGDISRELLARILRQAQIDRADWEKL
ncbi:MAG: type II toxin-antitoxin system HicA family toxin [Chloroflexia bacterium]